MSEVWQPIDLAALEERPPVEPTIGGLVYPGRRHVFSGPPEAAKTWVALILATEVIRAGGTVLHFDFEMFAFETRDRLRTLGLTKDELSRFHHFEPETEANNVVVGQLVDRYAPTLVIIDACAGAYALQGLDDNKRADVELFARSMVDPFRRREVATIVLDHVTKNSDSRGAFAIGSERKIGGADVHLGFQMVAPFGRGRAGVVKITTHKDRFGFLPRPRAAVLELRSDRTSHAVTWEFRGAADGLGESGGSFRPTLLMEKVSRYLERHPGASRSALESAGLGKSARLVRLALDVLILEGYVGEETGARGARLNTPLRPFTSPSSELVRPRPDDLTSTPSTSSTPYKGDEVETTLLDEARASVLLDEVERAEQTWAYLPAGRGSPSL